MSVPMTLSDLEMQDARGPFFPSDLHTYVAYFDAVRHSNTAIPNKMWNVHNLAASKRTNINTEGWKLK